MKVFILLSAILSVAAMVHAKPQRGGRDGGGAQTDAMAGLRISDDDAKKLEDDVAKNPDDISARAKLLGYYFMKQRRSAEAEAAYRGHVLWIIKNHPESKVARMPICGLDPITDEAGYAEGKQIWLSQIESHPQDPKILFNAASYFSVHDRQLAEKVAKQGEKLEPQNPEWPDMLAHLYTLQKDSDGNAKSLAELERANAIDTIDGRRTERLVRLAEAAYAAGELEKAKKDAEELLKLGTQGPQNWNYGNAIHHGNNVLGRIAFQEGHIPQACEYLLKAGDTPGSPTLNTFGPNMSLAQSLLKAGQNDTVLQYFAECRKFWKMGGSKLDDWTKQVKEGKTPEFGANLWY